MGMLHAQIPGLIRRSRGIVAVPGIGQRQDLCQLRGGRQQPRRLPGGGRSLQAGKPWSASLAGMRSRQQGDFVFSVPTSLDRPCAAAGNVDHPLATQDNAAYFRFNAPVHKLVFYRSNPFVTCIKVVAQV